ncbi:hypothetical protein K502DRAFT_325424 [Neoconidiobolus thromboides FSU 785]|nr:hypothetical protein K502DRAFT_325424 [Neoconidiobolus thromboides FSU 785]
MISPQKKEPNYHQPLGSEVQLEEDLDYMSELPIEFLSKLLEDNGYELEKTMNILIDQEFKPKSTAPTIPTDTTQPDTTIKKPQVCRHFIEGSCFRKDCWFSHSLDSTVCKFWLKGFCANGDSCHFLHKVDTVTITNKLTNLILEPTAKKESTITNKFEFPDLINNTQSNSNNNFWKSNKIAIKSEQNSKKMSYLKDKLPWVPNTILLQYLNSARDNELTAYSLLKQRFPKPKEYGKSKTIKDTSGPQSLEKRIKGIPKRPEVIVPWVETGSAVSQIYLDYRSKAIELAKIRNSYFEKARSGYLNNKMDTAKQNSLEGQKYNLLMKEQHRLAAKAILQNRKGKDKNVLDLHGLHVNEALSVLEESIQFLRNDKVIGKDNLLYIIIGSGHHSKQNARLLPNVLDYLDTEKIHYVDCSTDGRGGMLKLEV